MQKYNISDRLKGGRPVIVIDEGHEYEVNNEKTSVIKIREITKDKEISDFAKDGDKTDKIIETALGKDALAYLKTKHLSVKGWGLVVEAIMAAIAERPLEEIEKEADKAEKEALKTFQK